MEGAKELFTGDSLVQLNIITNGRRTKTNSIERAGFSFHVLKNAGFDIDGRQNVTLTQHFRDWGAPLLVKFRANIHLSPETDT